MEDAPLITKKGVLGDKCGSCNQYLMDKNNQFNTTQYNISQYMGNTTMQNVNHNNTNLNFTNFNGAGINMNTTKNPNQKTEFTQNQGQLRLIQDSSNKFNTGSYSRILNHANDDNVKDDLKPNPPNPLRNSGSLKNLPILTNYPTSKSNKFKESIDIEKDNTFQEALEKKNINGTQLVIKANKEFEKLEKQKKDKEGKTGFK